MKKKYIKVNENIASSATYISGGEVITLTIPQKADTKKKLIFPLKVLFEDEYLAAVYKPAGILVSGNHFKTVANALEQNLVYSPLEDATAPMPVHRLDYATTGVLLVGKTHKSIRILNKMFEAKTVSKTYYAITIGSMPKNGEITSEIDKKKSRSEFKVLTSEPSKRFGILNMVQLRPQTGRRHQLRIHLSSKGNPILGDKTYGIEGMTLKGKGLYLHAHSLEFEHPFNKSSVSINTELPLKFKKVFPLLDF